MDQEEARAIAEGHLKERPLVSLYESVFVPALRLAEQDDQVEGLDDNTRRFLFQSTKELIEDLGDRIAELPASGTQDDGDHQARQTQIEGSSPKIECMPARKGPDELVAMMLTQLLRHAGYQVRELMSTDVEEALAAASKHDFQILCVSSLPPLTVPLARSLCKRLLAREPNLQIVVGLWNFEGGASAARERLGAGSSILVSTTLSDALAQVRQLADSAIAVEKLAEQEKS
jgi:hypothetical protein